MSKRRHLSRLAAPKTWPISRKRSKWITKPLPGSHNLTNSLPLNVILRDILKVSSNNYETKKMLNDKAVLINNKVIREKRYSVGLLDVISLPKLKKNYRMVLSKQGKLNIINISEAEANILPIKIVNKNQISKKKTQINFGNGWNILIDKDQYKTNDVILYDTKAKKIKEHIPFAVNSVVYFTSGRHVSKIAKLVELKETGKLRKQKIAVVEADKNKWESSTNNIIIIGKAKPAIKLTDEN